MFTLLPAVAALTGAVALRQIPDATDLAGIFLVILGIGLHRPVDIEDPIALPHKRHGAAS
jgi:threonine/homoserine efflux transporter RhtA